ncbi:MAG: VWA domain-containing protein [Gammaproteobacteria bacterium]|nr:VWA domain-containing protein [Gammaproteobacteria bacterium]
MTPAELPDRSRLPENVVHFVRLLRAAGISCGVPETREALQAVEQVGVHSRDDFHDALASVLVNREREMEIFDQAFDLFWRNPRPLPQTLQDLLAQIKSRLAPPRTSRRLSERLAQHYFGAPPHRENEEDPDIEFDYAGTGSSRERLFHRDFQQLSPDEFFELKRLIKHLHPRLPRRTSRRTEANRSRGPLDWRRTARGLARGRLDLVRRRRRRTVVPLVVLCDMSGSMSDYTRATLLFFHALCQVRHPVEVFVFSTHVTRITPELRYRDADIALSLAASAASDWEGGTRLADCLEAFVDRWLQRVLARPSDLVLVSDGLDGCDPEAGRIGERLESSLAHLAASARSFTWMNPMLRYEHYESRALGPSILERHAGRRISGHNLHSLCELFNTQGRH